MDVCFRRALSLVAVAVVALLHAVPTQAQTPAPTPLERPAIVNLCVQLITREPWNVADLLTAVIEGRAESSDDASFVLLQVGEDGTCGDASEPEAPTATTAPDEAASEDAAKFLIFLLNANRLGGIKLDLDDKYAARQTARELGDLLSDLRAIELAPCFARVAEQQMDTIDLMVRLAEAVADDDYLTMLELKPEMESVSADLEMLDVRLDEARAACGAD